MYKVTTIVTPINYYSKGKHAVKSYNRKAHTELEELDVKILEELTRATRGYPAMKLRGAVQDKKQIFSAVFNRAVNRLIALKYCMRVKHRKWIYYSITMKGRNALATINDILTKMVEDQFKDK